MIVVEGWRANVALSRRSASLDRQRLYLLRLPAAQVNNSLPQTAAAACSVGGQRGYKTSCDQYGRTSATEIVSVVVVPHACRGRQGAQDRQSSSPPLLHCSLCRQRARSMHPPLLCRFATPLAPRHITSAPAPLVCTLCTTRASFTSANALHTGSAGQPLLEWFTPRPERGLHYILDRNVLVYISEHDGAQTAPSLRLPPPYLERARPTAFFSRS